MTELDGETREMDYETFADPARLRALDMVLPGDSR
jgi:hypothetical protein